MTKVLMYGRGNASIADQIGSSIQEADKIIQDFYSGFPKVRDWMDKTIENAKVTGYVEDFWGRRRRLPDIQLPKYTITDRGSTNTLDVNPLFGAKGLVTKTVNPNIDKYRKQLESARGWKQVSAIKDAAAQDKIEIRDNGAFISQAERQSINSRVQGGAASMSKFAMIQVYRNQQLRDLGFKMLLQVHDELIGECPVENVEAVSKLLSEVMKHSAEPVVTIPFKCDTEIVDRWYHADYVDGLHQEYTNMLNQGISPETALAKIKEEHPEYMTIDPTYNNIVTGEIM